MKMNKIITIQRINQYKDPQKKDLSSQTYSLKIPINNSANFLNNKRTLFWNNVLKVVEESLRNQLWKNTSRFVKKYFRKNANPSRSMSLMMRLKNWQGKPQMVKAKSRK